MQAIQTTNNILAIPDLAHQWIDQERKQGLAEKSLDAYSRGLAHYLSWVSDQGLETVLASDVLDYKFYLQENYSPQTANLRLSAVRSFYRFLVMNNYLPYSPAESVKSVKRSKSKKHKRKKLSVQQVRTLLDSCDNSPAGVRDRAILTLMVYCGLRVIEIQRANTDNLETMLDDTDNNRLVLWVQGKGRIEPDEMSVIPLRQETVIREWMNCRNGNKLSDALFTGLGGRSKGRLTTRSISRMIKTRMIDCGIATAGIDDSILCAHSLRYTALNRAISASGDIMGVKELARHSSIETTAGYIQQGNRINDPIEDKIEY